MDRIESQIASIAVRLDATQMEIVGAAIFIR
jgi:hypothetical protein